MSDKILGVLPKNKANLFLGGLIVTVVLGVIWSYLLEIDFIADNSIVGLLVTLVLAALVGWAVGMSAGDSSASTLWIAAGFAWVATLWANYGAGADFLDRFTQPLAAEAFSLSVSVAAIVVAIVAAAFASVGSKK